MTSSIILTDTINITFNKKHRFKYEDTELNEVYEFEREEIPAVRYRFKEYGTKEIVYIKNNLKKFTSSVHIAEVELCEKSVEWINSLLDLKEVAVFLYFDLHKDNIVSKSFNEEQRQLLMSVKTNGITKIERIMMRDAEGLMHMMVARPLMLALSGFMGLNMNQVGYCGCAFSNNGQCCLTAERARDIAARYSSNTNFAIATNAVEGKNIEHQHGCYCIKHILITHDIVADAQGSTDEFKLEETKGCEIIEKPSNKAGEGVKEIKTLSVSGVESLGAGESGAKKKPAKKKTLRVPKGAVR